MCNSCGMTAVPVIKSPGSIPVLIRVTNHSLSTFTNAIVGPTRHCSVHPDLQVLFTSSTKESSVLTLLFLPSSAWRFSREKSAKAPPCPLSSARSTMRQYLRHALSTQPSML